MFQHVADLNESLIIKKAFNALTIYGEANSRMRQVASLPLTFQAIMNVVRASRYPAAKQEEFVRKFHRALHIARRSNTTADMFKANKIYETLPFKPVDQLAKAVAEYPASHGGKLYASPNGGKRILPSLYCRLKDLWLKASKLWLEPRNMNTGHLEATLKLLKESHGNLVAKSTSLLGKMARHYQHQPEIVAQLESLCLQMQKVEVDKMYPIFTVLSEELHSRAPAIVIDPESFIDNDFGVFW